MSWCQQPGVPVRHHYKVTMSAQSQLSWSVPLPPLGLSHSCEAQIYLTRSLVSSIGAIIVAVLRPVLFRKCASSNYKATQLLIHVTIILLSLLFINTHIFLLCVALWEDMGSNQDKAT